MTDATFDVDETVISEQDPDIGKPCQARNSRCPNEAQWRVRCLYCGATTLLCDKHKESNDAFIQRMLSMARWDRGLKVWCCKCGVTVPASQILMMETLEHL